MQRIDIGVKLAVGAGWRQRYRSRMALGHRSHRLCRAVDGVLGQFGGVRVARRFTRHSAQAEALHRVERGSLEPSVIERERLTLAVLEKEFAVVGALERIVDEPLYIAAIQTRSAKEDVAVHRANSQIRRA